MKTFQKIVSILATGLLAVSSICLTISVIMKWNLQEEKLSATLEATDISFLLNSFGKEEAQFVTDTRKLLETIGIPSDTIEDFLNSDVTKDFLSKYTIEILNYFMYETKIPEVTKKDIETLVMQNYTVIEDSLEAKGLTFSETQKQFIENNLEKYSKVIMDFFPTMNLLAQKLEENVTFYQGIQFQDVMHFLGWFTYSKTIFALGISVLILFVILIACNFSKKQFWIYLQRMLYAYIFVLIGVEIILGTIIKEWIMKEIVTAQEFTNYMVNVLCKDLWIFIILAIVVVLLCNHFKKGRKKYASILDELYPRSREKIEEESGEK